MVRHLIAAFIHVNITTFRKVYIFQGKYGRFSLPPSRLQFQCVMGVNSTLNNKFIDILHSVSKSALYSDELSGEHNIDDTRRWNNMDKPHKWILNTEHYDEYRPFEELLRFELQIWHSYKETTNFRILTLNELHLIFILYQSLLRFRPVPNIF